MHFETLFGNTNPVDVEIGFGNGEYLARMCESQPHLNWLGFEQYCERIARTLRKLSRANSTNVRVMRLDAKAGFERYCPERSIRQVHCLYPPPWPKKSDIKHRLFTSTFLRTVNNRLIDGGTLLLVTDFKPYTEWIQEQLPGTGFELKFNHITPNYGTKFENKWVEGGQQEFYEMIMTKTQHLPAPIIKDIPMQTYCVPEFNPATFQLKEYSDGNVAAMLKDIFYDPIKKTALIHAIVTDEGVTQYIYIAVAHTDKGWRIRLAEGSLLMPTQGIAKAIELVHESITGK